ncbi:MAG: hypothetical protein V4473_00095 [Patescibacteria group bacterium]
MHNEIPYGLLIMTCYAFLALISKVTVFSERKWDGNPDERILFATFWFPLLAGYILVLVGKGIGAFFRNLFFSSKRPVI